jgi:hypothetical protein
MHWISPRNISRSFRIVLALCVIFTALVAFSPLSRAANGMAGATSRAKSATALGFAEDSKTQSDCLPAGTILPVRLPSISSKNAKAGDKIKAKLAQDVRLPDGSTIRGGATVRGEVVAVTNASATRGATLTIKFDALLWHGKSTNVRTHLRAMASMMEVEEAQMPTSGPGESDVYDWLTTRQVGGDSVYGKQGPVVGKSQTVGQSTYQGVFVRLLASADGRCRGGAAGNDRLQAVWVFSADACGLYGFGDLEIRNAGRTEPLGEIILESKRGPVKIREGSAALLRVDEQE